MIELRTFGNIELAAGEGGAGDALLAQPKRFALFCYLALPKPGTLHRRDTLLGVFWPEADQEQARMDLRQALAFIRRVLGEDVLINRGAEEVGLNPDRVWCDAAAFQDTVEQGRWVEAAESYRGEFLKGFFLSKGEEFEHWLDGERARLAGAYGTALERAIDTVSASGDARMALEYSERLVEHDRYNSRYAMKLMEALVVADDPANALLYAERHRELLRDEFDIAPPTELQALAERIRQESETLRPSEGPQSEEDMLPQLGAVARPSGGVESTEAMPPRQAKSRWKVAAVAGAFAAVIAVIVSVMLISRGGGVSLDPERVVVAVFRNETGDPALDLVGRMAGHWITQGIQQTGTVQVMPWETALASWLRVEAEVDSGRVGDPVRALAEKTGAGTVISGAYYLHGASIRFQADVNDAARGRLVGTLDPVHGQRDSLSEIIGELRQRAMGFLAVRFDERLALLGDHAGDPPRFDAYQAFNEGLERWIAGQDPKPHFRRAVELDTTYAEALLYLAIALDNSAQFRQADSVLNQLGHIRERLTPYYLAYAESLRAKLAGDLEGALVAARRAARLAPGSRAWHSYGVFCVWTNRPREAIRVFTELDPESEVVRGNNSTWSFLAGALHTLGEHERELEVALRYRRLYPDRPGWGLMLQSDALAALGRVDELKHVLDELANASVPIFHAPGATASL